jgi:hypothetical protein
MAGILDQYGLDNHHRIIRDELFNAVNSRVWGDNEGRAQ